MEEIVFARTYVSRGVNTDNEPPTWSPSPDLPDLPSASETPPTPEVEVKAEPNETSTVIATAKKPHWMTRADFRGARLAGINPCVYGDIPGVLVGTYFETRAHCSAAGVHGVLVAGVHGDPAKGAYSIVLAGEYDDDKDLGETFTYTGTGGRDTGKGKGWNGKQVTDQSWEKPPNAALKVSCNNQRPVRVVRGRSMRTFKRNEYMPAKDQLRYRYDGLYVVERAYEERGQAGFLMCKFDFKRLPNQPPLPVNEGLVSYQQLTVVKDSPVPDAGLSASAPGPVATPELVAATTTPTVSISAPPVVKRRGRPYGSKNRRASAPSPSGTGALPVPTPLQTSTSASSAASSASTVAKRPRGRPRKRPLPAPAPGPIQQDSSESTVAPLPTPPASNPLPIVETPISFASVPPSLMALATIPFNPVKDEPGLSQEPDAAAVIPSSAPSSAPPATSEAPPSQIMKPGPASPRKPFFGNFYLENNKSDENTKYGFLAGDKSDMSSIKLEDLKQDALLYKSDVMVEKLEIGGEEGLLSNDQLRGTKRPLEPIENGCEERYLPRPRLE